MKLLLYSDSRYYSGAEKVLADLAMDLAKKGIAVTLVVSPEFKGQLPEAELGQVEVVYQANQAKLSLSNHRNLRKLLRNIQPDLVIVNMWSPFANTPMLLAAKKRRVKAVTVFHYYQRKSDLKGPLRLIKIRAYAFANKLSATVVSPSRALAEVLIHDFLFPADKVVVVPNGVPLSNPGSRSLNLGARKLLAVGSIEESKGQEYLLPIIANLDGDWTLDIAGVGPRKEPMLGLIESLNLGGKVKYLGRVRTDSDFYRNYDFLIHPSMFENLSLAIIEALGNGLPVICHDAGGNAELVENEKSGYLIPLKNDQAWSDALEKAILMTPERYQHMSEEATSVWRSRYRVETMSEGYLKVINELLKK